MKCKFFKYKNENGGITTIAVSRYAGRKVKAYAKCNPVDEYDEAKGEALAGARCAVKVAEKRLAHSSNRYMQALMELNEAVAHFEDMKVFYMDCVDQLDEAIEKLEEISKGCE